MEAPGPTRPERMEAPGPTRPERAEAPSPGHRPGYDMYQMASRPERAKAFVIQM